MTGSPAAWAARTAGSAGALARCTMWVRHPVRRVCSSSIVMARCSASGGREARKSAYRRPRAAGAAAITSASSACAMSSPPKLAISVIAAPSWARSSGGNSSTPEGSRKHLKPTTPASCRGRRSAALPGTAPPQNATSTASWPAAAACLARSAGTVTVGGMLFSGMSTIVVTPPAAAAAVAVANPSHSVRPGSFTCTWLSTSPGSSTSSRARVRVPGGASP